MSDELPAAWRVHTDRKGISSYRRLGVAAGIAHETARRVVRGASVKPVSVQAVADALGVDVEEVYALRDETTPDFSQEWKPPASSRSLTHEEREALSRLIALMTAGRDEESGQRGDTSPIGVVIEPLVFDPGEPTRSTPRLPLLDEGTDLP